MEKIYGLIGEKLGHSFSVPIHAMLGRKEYRLYELRREELAGFLANPNLGGLNVTIPYKREVMPYCAQIAPEAQQIGSVNTIVNREGKLWAYNTDLYGFVYMVQSAGISMQGKKVLILGNGGTSLTAQAAAKKLGAREVVVMSRRAAVTYADLPKHTDSEILVNTTPVGMYPNNLQAVVELGAFANLSGVVDVIFNPARTKLVLEAAARGIPATGGLKMLVAQAKQAEEYFYGRAIDDARIEEIYRTLSCDTGNIVLTGMPGSGKTSVGRALAKMMGREAIDIDDEIAQAAGRSIPEIFQSEGEAGFRARESAAIREAGKGTGKVIMTGGGAVLREENYAPLKQNGRIYQLSRDIELLAMGGRPLSTGREALYAMQEQRAPFYARFRDVCVENDTTVEEAARKILREFCENGGKL